MRAKQVGLPCPIATDFWPGGGCPRHQAVEQSNLPGRYPGPAFLVSVRN